DPILLKHKLMFKRDPYMYGVRRVKGVGAEGLEYLIFWKEGVKDNNNRKLLFFGNVFAIQNTSNMISILKQHTLMIPIYVHLKVTQALWMINKTGTLLLLFSVCLVV
ncbi:hypothetical protein ACJX0J_023907, partial [Zea mays]